MKRIVHKVAAGCLVAGIVAGGIVPRMASAHAGPTDGSPLLPDGYGNSRHHVPRAPDFDVRRATDSTHDSIVVSWEESHYHPTSVPTRDPNGPLAMHILADYRIFVREVRKEQVDPGTCARFSPLRRPPDGCISRIVSLGGPSYSATIAGLQPDRTYYVWMAVRWRVGGSWSGEVAERLWATPGPNPYAGNAMRWIWNNERGNSSTLNRKTITTLPSPSQTTPTNSASHTHDYAPAGHSHSVPNHFHQVPNHQHNYTAAGHTHRYASVDHTHSAGTGTGTGTEESPSGTGTSSTARNCPRFIELEDPWIISGSSEYKKDGSVWVAVDAIEYLTTGSVQDGVGPTYEGIEIRMKEAHSNYSVRYVRSFLLEDALLADVMQSVRCSTGAVTTTVEPTE